MEKRKRKRKGGVSMNAFTSCISTTLVLLLLGTVVFFVTLAGHFSNSLRENFTVSLMLDDAISPAHAYQLQSRLRALPCTRLVTYISKERALREQSQALGSDPTEFLGSNPMPASFELHLKGDYANKDSVAKFIPPLKQNDAMILEVSYPQSLMDSLNDNIQKISSIMLIIALLLTFVSFELINNTIRLSVHSRRFMIHTMKLVGANWSFIRRPFLLKALLIGIISAILAGGLLVGGIIAMTDYEPNMAGLITWDVIAATLGVVVLCGILLTLLCAYFSVNKNLRMDYDQLYRR